MSKIDADPALKRLVQIMATLRSPEGCPWDARQTPHSLKACLLEETYEVLDAIDRGSPREICEELGDLLLQVVFHARIFQERGQFDLTDVINGIADKLVRRHPHVFEATPVTGERDLWRQWEAIKRGEKPAEKGPASRLGELPNHLPALMAACKLGERASRAGFDWTEAGQAFAKVREELKECEEAFRRGNQDELAGEIGDLLFAAVNLGRYLQIDPEDALRQTGRRFTRRFQHLEGQLRQDGREVQDLDMEELLLLWQAAKKSSEGLIADQEGSGIRPDHPARQG